MKTNRSRRDFLKVSAAGALGTLVFSQYSYRNAAGKASVIDPKTFGIGLQLYTIRDAMATDVPGSLKKVSDAGYKYVELADYTDGKFYGYAPSEFKKYPGRFQLFHMKDMYTNEAPFFEVIKDDIAPVAASPVLPV